MNLLFTEQQAVKHTHPAMGTLMTHQIYGETADDCLAAVEMEIERLEALFSRFRPGSDISRINQKAGMCVVKISEETMQILLAAQEMANTWPNAFDITVTPLVNLWRQAAQNGVPPAAQQISQTLRLVSNEDLLLNPAAQTAALRKPGQELDLGGIAKGYTANRLRDCFTAFGIHSAFSNLGGNVIALGYKPDGSSWRIGIQHPRHETELIGAVSIENESVVTSGDYQRYFTGKDGKRYHHIIDPRTGFPSESDLISVTIITRDAMLADSLSTLLFIEGLEKGIEIVSNYPECESILVNTNCQVFITKGLADRFIPANQYPPTILSVNGVTSK